MGYVMREAGLGDIGKYISRKKNTVVQYIANHLILDLRMYTTRRLGLRTPIRWW